MKPSAPDQSVLDECLRIALGNGNHARVAHYLDMGASADAVFKDALRLRDMHMLDLLLQHGADVNLRNTMGAPPLMAAVTSDMRARSTACVELLLAHGADAHAVFVFTTHPVDVFEAIGQLGVICTAPERAQLEKIGKVIKTHILSRQAQDRSRHHLAKRAGGRFKL